MSPSAGALAVAGVLGAGAVIALLVGLLIGVGRLNATLSDTNDRLVTTDQLEQCALLFAAPTWAVDR